MSVVVRELLATDRYALAAVQRAVAGRNVSDRDPATGAFLTDPATFTFGAYVGDQPVGWAWGVTQRFPDGRLASYVHEIDVVAGAREQGVASMLLRAVFARARRAGHGRVWLVTGVDNAAACALYESLGGARRDTTDVVYRWDL